VTCLFLIFGTLFPEYTSFHFYACILLLTTVISALINYLLYMLAFTIYNMKYEVIIHFQ